MWGQPPRLSYDGEAERLRHIAKSGTDIVSRLQELNNNRRHLPPGHGPFFTPSHTGVPCLLAFCERTLFLELPMRLPVHMDDLLVKKFYIEMRMVPD